MYQKENILLIGYLSDKKRGLENEPVLGLPFHSKLLRCGPGDDVYKIMPERLGLYHRAPAYRKPSKEPFLPGIVTPGSEIEPMRKPLKRSEVSIERFEVAHGKKGERTKTYYLVIVHPKKRSKVRKTLKNKLHWVDKSDMALDLAELRKSRRRQICYLLEVMARHPDVAVLRDAAMEGLGI